MAYSSKRKNIEPDFNRNRSANYTLLVAIGKQEFSYAILDYRNLNFLGAETLVIENKQPETFPVNEIETFIKQHELLNLPYKNTLVTICDQKSTLLPEALFDKEAAKHALSLVNPLDTGDQIEHFTLKSMGAVNCFAVNSSLRAMLKTYYPDSIILHHSCGFIEGINGQLRSEQGAKVIVNFHLNYFELCIMDGAHIIFYNSFKYQTSEDFIYYVLFACEQLKLSPVNSQVFIYGEVDKGSAVLHLLNQYFKTINFGKRFRQFSYTPALQQLPEHFYFSLYCSALCV